MSLQACRECKHEISRDAEACPHCGAPVSRVHITAGVVLQLVFLAVAVGLALPLVKQEFFASTHGVDDPTSVASAAPDAKPKRAAERKKTSRPALDCESDEVQRGVTQAWRDEVAQALSRKAGDPADGTPPSPARMKLGLSAFQTLDEDRAAGVVQCAAVMTVSEGNGFQASDSQVTYRVELAGQGRNIAVTLIYARMPPV